MSSDLEKMCPNLTEHLGLSWDLNSKEMISYWLLRIGELGSSVVILILFFRYAPELLKSLFLFYQKHLDHKLESRKQDNDMKKWEREIGDKLKQKRKPPS